MYKMNTNLPKLCYTKIEAAEMLGLEPASIDWLIRKGTLPRRKIAGKIRFTLEDLQGLIDASAVTQCCATE